MAIANPRIHIICGICGNKDMMSFVIEPLGACNNEGEEYPAVHIRCANCASLSNLTDVLPEEQPRSKG